MLGSPPGETTGGGVLEADWMGRDMALAGNKWLRWGIAVVIPVIVVLSTMVLGPSLFSPRPASALASTTTLTILSGSVQIQTSDGAVWRPGWDGMTLYSGHRVRTSANSYALITFFEGSTITLEPEADLAIRVLESASDGPLTTILLRQWAGATWSRVVQLVDPASRYEIETPSAVALVRGTLLEVAIQKDGATQVRTLEGAVQVSSFGAAVTVGAGEETRVGPGQPPQQVRPIPTPLNRLRVELHSRARMVVVDPLGRSVGIVPPGVVVNQVTGSRTTKFVDEPQIIDIDQVVSGDYKIILYGKAQASYRLVGNGQTGGGSVFDLSQEGQFVNGDPLIATLRVRLATEG